MAKIFAKWNIGGNQEFQAQEKKKKNNKHGNNGMKLVQTEKRVQEKRELTFSLAH